MVRRLTFALLFLLACYQSALAQTTLGKAAASLPVGQWTKITTNNIAVPSQAFANLFYQVSFPGYDGNVAAWNATKKQYYFVSTSDPQLVANGNTPLVIYDDATNNWTIGPTPGNPTGEGFHAYDHVAWDAANEVLYYRPGLYGGTKVYRYCVNNAPAWCVGKQGTWSLLPDPTAQGGCYQIAVALTYHATMDGGSLLCYDGERGIQQYRESTGAWSGILPGTLVSGTGAYDVCAEYNPISQVTVFGCGASGLSMYKIDNNKTVTQIANAPSELNYGVKNHDMVADPNSGDFIVVVGYAPSQGRLYRLNPSGSGAWTLLDNDLNTAGKICETYHDKSAGCSADFYGASVPTYGVIMYWKYLTPTTGEVWLYRPSAGGAGGGSDFTTRCNAAGVLFCNGFDSVGDLGGDGWGSARGRGPSNGTQFCGVTSNCPTIDTTTKVSGAGALKFTIPSGMTGNAAGAYWANPAADFSVRFGANQTYYVQFRQRITASYFPAILVDNDKIHWVSTTPDLPGCSVSNTTNCFSSCTENELVNQNLYGVASDALPRWYNGCPGANSFQYVEPVTPGYLKLQNARTGVGCTYDNVQAGNRFPPSGNCFPYYPDQWVTYSYKISLGSLGTGAVGGLCYDGSNPGTITPNLQNCYYGNQIQARMGLDGQPLEEVLNWTGPVIAKDQKNPTELKYGKVYFAPYTGTATIASGASIWFDELIISTQPIADPGSGGTITPPANVTLTRRRIQ
jgi:hypothetical protein